MKDKKWETFCRSARCCPEVALEGDTVWIKDDDGHVIHMERGQVEDLWKRLQEDKGARE